MRCAVPTGQPVMSAWRRYRRADQEAWADYQAASRSAYELLQQQLRDAFDRCEQLARASMASFAVQVAAWHAAENGIETDAGDDALTDPATAWDDHLGRVSQAVRHRESAHAGYRAGYRAAAAAAKSAYEERISAARGQWMTACGGRDGRHDDPYAH